MTKRWVIASSDSDAVSALSTALRIGLPAAKVLVSRGLGDLARARQYLALSLDELPDPFLMRDLPRALDRLRRAICERQRILIYGDTM